MSDELLPAAPASQFGETQLQPWQASPELPALAKSPLERPVAAIRRYKWLMLAVMILSAGAGVAATRVVTPQYEVRASIMIAAQSPMDNQRTGPIRAGELLNADDWAGLLRSFVITDAVVRELSLYLQIDNSKLNAELFKGFKLAESYSAGDYELAIDRTRKRWTLVNEPAGTAADSGTVADSLGRRNGFLWKLDPAAFSGTGERTARFTVSTPREAAVGLIFRLNTSRSPQSNFLRLSLQDPDGKLAATVVNTWVHKFVDVAATIKRRKLVDYANTLEDQLHTAKQQLEASEVALSSYRVNTITLGGEQRGVPIAAGIAQTNDPVTRDFFTRKIDYDDLKHDISLLERLIASAAKDSIPSDAFLEIRSAANSPETATLRTTIAEFHMTENKLAEQRTALTDDHPSVKLLVSQLYSLKKVKIPGYASDLLASLKTRAVDDSVRIAAAGENLQKIPERTIEEERLTRIRDVNASLYGNLQNRFAEAQLAEASATPDISVLDTAIAPLSPTKNTASRLIFGAVGGGIGLALALAILLDRLDGRLRYPEQATGDLGLPIAGTVPRFPKGGINQDSPEQMFQLVESFRSLRMSVIQANPNHQGAVSVAVSSPSPNEGKSLIAANLAMSFADAGLRTILVDGDTRRGALHDLFGVPNAAGLTDLLSGAATTAEVIHQTPHDSLYVLPCGRRRRRSPELLTSSRLPQLVAELRANYDVVIFDTPPLAAGIDGYSIATATGSLLVVLRVGSTARRMAGEKLRLFERLPVDIVGAVLNGIQFSDGYGYYGYVPGYEAVEESESTDIVTAR